MKIQVLAGHYGSGKTQLAVNLALRAKETYPDVALCDLDIVNPYFRSIDCQKVLENAGVRLISSEYAGSNAEMPGFPPHAAAIFDNPTLHAIVDVGGDDRGALALGRYAERLRDTAEMLLVINIYRPLTRDVARTVAICREIEGAARLSFGGIINNANLGSRTTAQDLLDSLPYAQELARTLGLPIRYTAAAAPLVTVLDGQIDNLLPLTLYHKPEWQIEEVNPRG